MIQHYDLYRRQIKVKTTKVRLLINISINFKMSIDMILFLLNWFLQPCRYLILFQWIFKLVFKNIIRNMGFFLKAIHFFLRVRSGTIMQCLIIWTELQMIWRCSFFCQILVTFKSVTTYMMIYVYNGQRKNWLALLVLVFFFVKNSFFTC